MAVTREQLAAALRILDASDAGDGPILDRLIAVGAATAGLAAPDAPDGVADEAVIRFAGWLYDAPPESSSGAGWQSCGAAALLAPWRTRSFALVDPGPATPAPAPPGGGGLPPLPGEGHYILTVDDGVVTWVEFPKP